MAKLPSNVAENQGSQYLLSCGFTRLGQGKVRDMYSYPGRDDLLLMRATDRLSIFDFVLPVLVPLKAQVLTALTWFWLTEVLADFPSHLYFDRDGQRVNTVVGLRSRISGFPVSSTLVVMRCDVQPAELIVRGHIGGSVWRQYQEFGEVAGQKLPDGLRKWDQICPAIFTPSTKEADGHDVNISVDGYLKLVGEGPGREAIRLVLGAYATAYEYARQRGILILDSKFEVNRGGYRLVDEVLTPDSSRFTTVEDLEAALAEGRDPVFYDKQVVREWGAGVETPFGVKGINKLDPKDPDHLAFVHGLKVPREVVRATTERYLEIFCRLTGRELGQFQKKAMGI